MFERVAGLDVGKASVTVCVRTPSGRAGRRRSETRTFSTMTRSLGVMRDWLVDRGGDGRGDRVDLDVLEAAVLLPGGGHGRVAAQRRAHEGGPGPQDRCARRGVDRAVARARVAAALVRAAAGDPPAAAADPLPRSAVGGPDAGDDPAGADARGRLDQAVGGGVESEDGVGAGDAGRDDRRRAGPAEAGRAGQGQAAQQDPATDRGADRQLRRASRPPGPLDPAPPGPGRGGVGRTGRRDRSTPASRGRARSSCCRPSPASG